MEIEEALCTDSKVFGYTKMETSACKIKPYELIDRKENKEKEVSKKVMLEDGLEDVENLANLEKEELKDALLADAVSDNIGANYLKVINHFSFFDAAIYTV